MTKIKRWLKAEFVSGQTKFDWWFLGTGIFIETLAVIFTALLFNNVLPLDIFGMRPEDLPANTAQMIVQSISGIVGIVAVVWCAKGKISSYIFNYTQLITYVFGIAIPCALWGEVIENVFYFVSMFFGIYVWYKLYRHNSETDGQAVKARVFKYKGWIISLSILIVSTIALGFVLTYMHEWSWLNWLTKGEADTRPWFDSITTTAPFIGQVLLVLGYREQWAFWIIEDIFSLVMFITLGNWIMVAQYLFWTINCIYGWIKWTKENKI